MSETVSNVKDVLLYVAGALTALVAVFLPISYALFIIIILGFILLVLIGEITGSPLWKVYNRKIFFKTNVEAEKAWYKLENPLSISKILSNFIDYKNGFEKNITATDFSEENHIMIASYNLKLLESFTSELKVLLKPVKIDNTFAYSNLQRIFGFDKRPWYKNPIEPGTVNHFEFKRTQFSITAGEGQTKNLFDIIVNKISTIPKFKKEKQRNRFLFSLVEKDSQVVLVVKAEGSNVFVGLSYGELDVENYGGEPRKLYMIQNKLEEIFDDVGKYLRKQKIEYKEITKMCKEWEGKVSGKKVMVINIH